jgi:hypothetical protein
MTCEEGAEGAFETCHPERSRGVSGHEWGATRTARAQPRGLRTRVGRYRNGPSEVEGSPEASRALHIRPPSGAEGSPDWSGAIVKSEAAGFSRPVVAPWKRRQAPRRSQAPGPLGR